MELWQLILGILSSIAAFILWWAQKEYRRKKEEIYRQLHELEGAYREALFAKDPVLAAQIAKQMSDLRDKYKFLKENT